MAEQMVVNTTRDDHARPHHEGRHPVATLPTCELSSGTPATQRAGLVRAQIRPHATREAIRPLGPVAFDIPGAVVAGEYDQRVIGLPCLGDRVDDGTHRRVQLTERVGEDGLGSRGVGILGMVGYRCMDVGHGIVQEERSRSISITSTGRGMGADEFRCIVGHMHGEHRKVGRLLNDSIVQEDRDTRALRRATFAHIIVTPPGRAPVAFVRSRAYPIMPVDTVRSVCTAQIPRVGHSVPSVKSTACRLVFIGVTEVPLADSERVVTLRFEQLGQSQLSETQAVKRALREVLFYTSPRPEPAREDGGARRRTDRGARVHVGEPNACRSQGVHARGLGGYL
mmetsp:Transcript_46702/g.130290  ORF Transcript_46702/g.130290 Transcript_46702/m.130290 type:complete len:339 (+) Transcript_46702:741-1757(+)